MERALDPEVTCSPCTVDHSKPPLGDSLPFRSFLNPPTHPVKNVSKGLRRLTLGGTRQSSGLVLATSFHGSTLYFTLECQLLAYGFSLLRVAFSWSRGVYLYDEGLLLECAGGSQLCSSQVPSGMRSSGLAIPGMDVKRL